MNIVKLCWGCLGRTPPSDPAECWSCSPSRRAPTHPGKGYMIEAHPETDFEPGDTLVDGYTAERWRLERRGKHLWMTSLDRAFEHQVYSPSPRYISPEEAADPETWRAPKPPAVAARTPKGQLPFEALR